MLLGTQQLVGYAPRCHHTISHPKHDAEGQVWAPWRLRRGASACRYRGHMVSSAIWHTTTQYQLLVQRLVYQRLRQTRAMCDEGSQLQACRCAALDCKTISTFYPPHRSGDRILMDKIISAVHAGPVAAQKGIFHGSASDSVRPRPMAVVVQSVVVTAGSHPHVTMRSLSDTPRRCRRLDNEQDTFPTSCGTFGCGKASFR
ncbi:hypothetical protein C8T65DRAFT_661676 [Cerioporus squamosus]|nr:hypothetical protein C8T65DRAFT_661676 [Cerioporus squamosus]